MLLDVAYDVIDSGLVELACLLFLITYHIGKEEINCLTSVYNNVLIR